MPTPPLPDHLAQEAVDAVASAGGNLAEAARVLGMSDSTLKHRHNTAHKRGIVASPYKACEPSIEEVAWGINDATILAFGDCHWYSPHIARSLAHEAALKVAAMIRPTVLLCTGDAIDFSEVSRHDPVGWQPKTRVKDGVDATKLHLADMRAAAGNPQSFWAIGNHDERYSNYLARNAAAFEGMEGMRLEDHFPDWRLAYRFDFGAFFALHRWHTGVHGAWNNAQKSGGVSLVTADTHRLRVVTYETIRDRHFGVETGMLADPNSPAFVYRRGRPHQWTPGFVVLTVKQGTLLTPELCEVHHGAAWFRGEPIVGRPRFRVQAGRG